MFTCYLNIYLNIIPFAETHLKASKDLWWSTDPTLKTNLAREGSYLGLISSFPAHVFLYELI